MNSFLDTYLKCPICKSKNYKYVKLGYLNRYSEEISKYLKWDETKLNYYISNRQCRDCRLVYKERWFKKNYLIKIFNFIIPIHPKGWDRLSNKFNKNHFINTVNKFLYYLKKNKKYLSNRYLRETYSLLDSIIDKGKNKKLKNIIVSNLKKNNLPKIKYFSKQISQNIKEPKEFSRFKGFESQELIDHIEKKIGTIKTYSEIGCPLWGNLNYLSKQDVQCFFVKGRPEEFWGKNCKKNRKNCISKLNKKIKITSNLNSETFKEKKDFIGLFLYLDHVTKPNIFFRKIFKNFKSCGIILENANRGVPIQHFSGWSKKTFQIISKKYKKKLDCSFDKLNSSEKKFYLIY